MVGQRLGSYRVLRKIGEGGMGAVFEAVNEQIGRRAAIKVLHPDYSQNEQIASRFFNEARAVNIVQHPGVVSVFEFGQLPDKTAYIVMEYLEGETLSSRIGRLGQNLGPDALRLSRQIASALAAAHAKGVVHRDLKPDNVMIVADLEAAGGERAKVLDFGIAKITDGPVGSNQQTRAGTLMGTPTYMSPEQCRGAGNVDDRTDVYALGIMLYEMLSGKPPFVAQGMGELMAQHLFNAPTPISATVPAVSAELAALVHRMIEKTPQARPPMAEVAVVLEHLGAPRATLPAQAMSAGSLGALGYRAAPSTGSVGGHRVPLGAGATGPIAGRPSTLGQSLGQKLGPAPGDPPMPGHRLMVIAGAALVSLSVIAGVGLWRGKDDGLSNRAGTEGRGGRGRVRWSVVSYPVGAQVISVKDRQLLGKTPWQREQPSSPGTLTVVLRADGFIDRTIDLDRSASVSLHEKLDPLKAPDSNEGKDRKDGKDAAARTGASDHGGKSADSGQDGPADSGDQNGGPGNGPGNDKDKTDGAADKHGHGKHRSHGKRDRQEIRDEDLDIIR